MTYDEMRRQETEIDELELAQERRRVSSLFGLCVCGHALDHHGPVGEKDCLCGKCMWFRPQ